MDGGTANLNRVACALTAATLGLLIVASAASADASFFRDDFRSTEYVAAMEGVEVRGGAVRPVTRPAPVSVDGIALARSQTGDPLSLISPSVVQARGLWYLYFGATYTGGSFATYLATSADGVAWSPRTEPVLGGYGGLVTYQDVLFDDAVGVFRMWYSQSDGSFYRIYYATSTDGIAWNPQGLALDVEIVDGSYVVPFAPSVMWTGTGYVMWYTTWNGASHTVSRAASIDGLSWSREGAAILPGTGSSFQDGDPLFPTVVWTGDAFTMWYTCQVPPRYAICRAGSTDGYSWGVEGVVLAPDPANPYMDIGIADPYALRMADESYRVWFHTRGTLSGSPGDEIHYGTTSDSSVLSGWVLSIPIRLPEGRIWRTLSTLRRVPAGSTIDVDVIDAVTGSPIPGFTGLTASRVSLSGLSSTSYPTIQLRAMLLGTSDAIPTLSQWSVDTRRA